MTDIHELFNRDPLELTKEDRREIIAAFRERRQQYSLGNTSAGSTKPKTQKQKEIASLADSLDFDV